MHRAIATQVLPRAKALRPSDSGVFRVGHGEQIGSAVSGSRDLNTAPERCETTRLRRQRTIKALARAFLAAEATFLWRRDVGRGITTGTMSQYIAFAVESFHEKAAAKEAA